MIVRLSSRNMAVAFVFVVKDPVIHLGLASTLFFVGRSTLLKLHFHFPTRLDELPISPTSAERSP